MKNLQDYIDDLSFRIDTAETEYEAGNLADEADGVASALRILRTHIKAGCDFAAALDLDLEHFEAAAAKESNRADRVADEIRDEEADIARYGSYGQQVRSIYSGGVL